LIHTKRVPNKEGLSTLTDDQLAKIGCCRTPDDPNSVVIKPTDSAVDKLVSAMLEEVDGEAKELVA
jgi:hypothetical protein